MSRLSAAGFAARRHLLGLTLDQIADALSVNPRTARSWETGRDVIPERITGEMEALIEQHDLLVDQMLDADAVVAIPRRSESDGRPGGWFLAAAARAIADDPDTMLEWR